MTDSCRRSGSVRVAAGTDIGAAGPACPMGLPQPPQNLAAGSFSKPQAGHCEGSGDPHSAQKRRVPAFSARQLGQRIQSLGLATRSAVRIPRGRSRQKRRFNARRDESRPPRKAENPPAANRPHAAPRSAPKPQKPWEVSHRGMRSRTETPIGQTSRSKALVRPGTDARLALAEVLGGVPAREILVRVRPD